MTISNMTAMQRLSATISGVAERVHLTRGRPSIPSRDATLAGLALSPQTTLELTGEEFAAVEEIVSARLSARQLAAR